MLAFIISIFTSVVTVLLVIPLETCKSRRTGFIVLCAVVATGVVVESSIAVPHVFFSSAVGVCSGTLSAIVVLVLDKNKRALSKVFGKLISDHSERVIRWGIAGIYVVVIGVVREAIKHIN